MKMVDKSSKLVDKFAVISGAGGGGVSGVGGLPIMPGSGLPPSGATPGHPAAALSGIGGSGGGAISSGSNGQKPVPMKLFAAWEVDRTPPNCIPRLCSLTITRLSILTPLPGDTTSLSLAVKMQSSKRTLRSHEIPINGSALTAFQQGNSPMAGGTGVAVGGSSPGNVGTGQGVAVPLTETELDLHFSLQYPHFIKRDGNRLVILLQRRKKYKSRTILGYKTLAEGIIRMDAVLQKSMDMVIELTASGKNGRPGTVVACLRAERVSSIPVDHDNKNNNSVLLADRVAEYSDEDEEAEFSSGEFNDEATELGIIRGYDQKGDYNPSSKHDMRKYRNKLQRSGIEDIGGGHGHHTGQHHPGVGVGGDSDSEFEMKDKSSSRAKFGRTISLQQRNFKQKIVALLKRFKVSEELEGESGHRGTAALRGERDLDALFQELESLSCCEGDDSGPDMDSISIGSTPKPSLRPFFTNSRIMLHDAGNGCPMLLAGGGGASLVIGTMGNSERRSSDKSDQLTNSSYNLENNKQNQKCIHLTNNNNSATTPDRGGNDSSGNEGNAGYTDGQNSDPQNSPPRDKDYMRMQQQLTPVSSVATSMGSASGMVTPVQTEKFARLFRTSSNAPYPAGAVGTSGGGPNSAQSGGKRKHTLSLSTEPRSVLETCLSPTNVEPRKLLLDQLSRVFAGEDNAIPEVVTIISPPEALGGSSLLAKLVTLFANSFKPAFVPQNTAEVKAVLQALMAKIQKYCNSNAKPPHTVKVLLIGGDWLQGATLRHYVELMGVRPPDWLNHLRFYLVPIGGSCGSVARHLSQMDQAYAAMFGSENWMQLCERAAATAAAVSAVTTVNATALTANLADAAGVAKSDIAELVQRIQRYLHAAGPCTQIPIAEAMVNYKDEDSCQIFVPFVSDVRIGYSDAQASLDLEENAAGSNAALSALNSSSASSSAIPIGSQSSPNVHGAVSGSPPQQQILGRISPPLQTPPSSASSHRERNTSESLSTPSSLQQQSFSGALAAVEAVELQVDYWPLVRPGETHTKESKGSTSKGGDAGGGKNSIKSTFRNLQVWRLPQHAQQLGDMFNGLTVSFATKEKKQKQIMRLGKKKDKERDLEKEQCVEGVARLICSPKQSHPVPLRVYIDGTEWTGVKFFQVSSQWQTHVKNFPIALIGCTPMSCAELS
ncbi:phosphofurin acidic cluster sorting protein 2 isoform X1 [Drosophila pseudoobscura]|uniref:Phosphofurin acidic cluster sorting protein 2 isoform X1 n=1 Tax=Drosophila pseudoobscura pseudoobscura TaxID=46245 RepID=A0A6I8UPP4_DROPS|nr:phosphofurin acidic cluster sorting protein 2 isoform X1 [Drosophila pseudoobscura]